MRAEAVEYGAAGSRFRALGVDFESPMSGRHAVMNLLARSPWRTSFDIAPERCASRSGPSPSARCAASASSINGIVIWNDCYNSNPEAAQSMIDVLRETPGRTAHRRAGRDAGAWALPPSELHRAGGPLCRRAGNRFADRRARQRARHGRRGCRAPGLRRAPRFFRGRRPRRAISRAQVARPATRSCSRARAACTVEQALERFLTAESPSSAA